MTDRELLELAAKAAGKPIRWDGDVCVLTDPDWSSDKCSAWHPLTDDGDALRLAVKLRICIDHEDCDCCVYAYPRDLNGILNGDEILSERLHNVGSDVEIQTREAATRRAIVRVAAELGRRL